jgi:hypothetical protein
MREIRTSQETKTNLQLLQEALYRSKQEALHRSKQEALHRSKGAIDNTDSHDDVHRGAAETELGMEAEAEVEFDCEASAERVKKAGPFWSIDLTLVLAIHAPAPHSPLSSAVPDQRSLHHPVNDGADLPLHSTDGDIDFQLRELTPSERLQWHRYDLQVRQSDAIHAPALEQRGCRDEQCSAVPPPLA